MGTAMRRDARANLLPDAVPAEQAASLLARDMQQVQVYIGAASPLLSYTPGRNQSNGWEQLSSGPSQCSSSSGGAYAVELDSIYFTAVQWVYSASASWSISAGLDGQLSSVSASADASLSTTWDSHSVRLEAACASGNDNFELSGIVLTTAVVASGTGVNATLDDSSSLVQYSGFKSVSSSASDVAAISQGSFYGGTVSYTSSAGASASIPFTGSAIYVFGATGPDCASYSISIDSASARTFDAYTSVNTYSTLLFFATHLDDAEHSIVITNGDDGKILALDYFVSVSATGSGSGTGSTGDSGSGSGTQTAAFPTGTGTLGSGGGGTNPGGIAGGIIGGLLGLCILIFWYRYYTYRKNGGQGSCAEACCGRRPDKPKPSDPEAFKIWPMLSFKPKYAT